MAMWAWESPTAERPAFYKGTEFILLMLPKNALVHIIIFLDIVIYMASF